MIQKADTLELLRHLATCKDHDAVKAGFRDLLVREFGVQLADVRFEQRIEVHSRTDALIGRTIFEAKRDLVREWPDVERKMPEYLANRQDETGEPWVGIASDGRRWIVLALESGHLVRIKETILDPEKADDFIAWLDGALALKSSLSPDALSIRTELGGESVAFHYAVSALARLWERQKNESAISLKRQLWAQLLKLVYGREVESDALWFQHTFLVIVAKCIAVAVLSLREDDPKRLLSGEAFRAAGINGAVESDFFDWVINDEIGRNLVRRIMAHVRRFRLAEVESDVLKVLYESLIDRDQRHGLGEYYTPDWLAAKIIRHSVTEPLQQRVLDPACGSGTFLFHAVRLFLVEAEQSGLPADRRAFEATQHVAGMDIHPVAVIIARVTYLLALAPVLRNRSGSISTPVYLGDAMQLSISEMIGGKELSIRVPPPPAGSGQSGETDGSGREQLDFPDTFCRDPVLFDDTIDRMRTASEQGMRRDQLEAALGRLVQQRYRADITEEQKYAIADLGKTYVTFDRLRKEGRDSVWAYVARNLSRPLAFSAANGWANVLVGNPPWVAFRHMGGDLQRRFKELSEAERIYVGRVPSQNDLCALFVVRSAALYLRSAGTLAFVLPLAALTRGQFEKFRTGSFESAKVQWTEAWTMDESVQPLFPVPSSVLFGRKRATPAAVPTTVRSYSGNLPQRDASEDVADVALTVRQGVPALATAQHEGGSPYRTVFRNGATLFPRLFVFVERQQMGRLGADMSAPALRSRRTSQEKAPWKNLEAITGQVESLFLRPVLLGESIVPFRVFRPAEGVVPATNAGEMLNSTKALERGFFHLADWMRKAEETWDAHKKSKLALTELFDYFAQLSSQFPISPLRVVYAKAGTQPAATLVRSSDTVIENLLYWAPFQTEAEAQFLVAILNSEVVRARAEAMQARGQWGARHFDKVMFNLPIPRFNSNSELHQALAVAATKAEAVAASVEITDAVKFQRARKLVRDALKEDGIAEEINKLVARLLGA